MGNDQSKKIELSSDNELKIYRQLVNVNDIHTSNGISNSEKYELLQRRHNELVSLYSMTSFTCPKVRFGRTGLQMPILTCGGMRQQQTWSPPADMTLADINKDIQANFAAIVKRSMQVSTNLCIMLHR